MNRAIVESWTQFLDGQTGPFPRDGKTAGGASPALRETLRSDLLVDALLRADGRSLGAEDGAAFVAAVVRKVSDSGDSDRFTQAVGGILQRKHSVRRAGALAVLIGLSAAAAWFIRRDAVEKHAPIPAGPSQTQRDPTTHERAPTMRPDDLRSPAADNPGSSAFAAATRQLLFVVGHLPATANDSLIAERFALMGFHSTMKLPSQLLPGEGAPYALVAISSSVESEAFTGPRAQNLARLAVPLVVWEPWLFDELELANCENNNGCGRAVAGGEMKFPGGGQPLLHASTQTVTVARTPIVVSFGIPLPSATIVATAETDQTRSVVFVYERGSALVNGPAPARRVALFLSDDAARVLTDEGWALFDGAITWAAGAP